MVHVQNGVTGSYVDAVFKLVVDEERSRQVISHSLTNFYSSQASICIIRDTSAVN